MSDRYSNNMGSKLKNIFLIFVLLFSINLFQLPSAIAEGETGSGENTDTNTVSGASKTTTDVICRGIKIIQGPTGKTIAILVTISLAIGLFLGKITWGVAIAVAVGMGVLFGANTVVGYISGEAGDPCADVN